MTTRRRVLLAAAAGLVGSAAVACARPGSTGGPGGADAGGPAETGGPATGEPSPDDAAAKADQVGARYPDRYAGVEVTPGGVVVYRKPGSDLDDAVRAEIPGGRVSFRDARYSRVELTALADRILADSDYWKAQGVPVWSVGARHDGSGVEVGTSAGDKLLAGARARYGEVSIIILPMTGPPMTLPLDR